MLSPRVRFFAALVLALAAVAATSVGLSALRSQGRAAHDAEKRLIALRLEMIQMLDIPWGASPAETDDPQLVRDELLGAEQSVLGEIANLSRTPGLVERDQFLAHFEPAVGALEQIWRAVSSGDDDALGDAPDVSARRIYRADSVLQAAADRYRREATQANAREAVGSTVLIGCLFLAFAVYFARATRSSHQLAHAAAELEVARDAALEASRAKSMFLATMSHEIRTPLTTVLATGEILEDTPLDDVQLRFLTRMRGAGEVLRRLIEEVLDFSRIEAGQVGLVVERFDLQVLVDDVADTYAARAEQARVRFESHVEAGVPQTMTSDRVRLIQVVGNLLDNAFKFSREGQVSLTVRPREGAPEGGGATRGPGPDQGVEFVVTDTGIGIPEERLSSIFQSFEQVDGSIARSYGGSGLGLAICKELTELMGGSISVQSELGAGSTFVVSVPACVPEKDAALANAGSGPV